MNQNNHHDDHLPWFDYEPGSQKMIPDNVKFLRIGYIEYQKLLQGNMVTAPLEIGVRAFQEHQNIQQAQIYLPAVSRILEGAFAYCQNLEEVEFVLKPKTDKEENAEEEGDSTPSSQLISIGNDAFLWCESMCRVPGLEHAAESLQKIGDRAFMGCHHALDSVDFLSSLSQLQSLGELNVLFCKSLTTVDLSKAVGLKELCGGTFAGCSALTIVQLPPNLIRIGDCAFWQCSSLEHILLPTGLQFIGNYAFEECKKLTTIVLPHNLLWIGKACFISCQKLSCVVLSSSKLPFLKLHPFNSSCRSVSSLKLPTPVPSKQWPLVLAQFIRDYGVARVNGQISKRKNRNTIVWNFLRQNMAQLFVKHNAQCQE